MVGKKVDLHMNSGDGKTSYANNSSLQKIVISKTFPILDDTLKAMYSSDHLVQLPKRLKMVDLGSSSGPNALFAMSHIVNTIENLCKQQGKSVITELPEFEVFLNDLPDNDFNNLFKLLPSFYQGRESGKETRNLFVYGLPGSFYGQLFPKNSLHFAYSSYSLHWLSQIPEALENNNKENIYIATTSPPEVLKAYKKQYQSDFSTFLSLRGEEIIAGGRMVLSFRGVEDPTTKDDAAYYKLLAKILLEMVTEGLVKLEDLYSFNMPIYMPSKQEVVTEIQNEGSFTLEKLHDFRVRWDANENSTNDDDDQSDKFFGKLVSDFYRAFMEPLLASHFGSSIVDDLFKRFAKKMREHLSVEKISYFTIVVSLCRR